MDSRERVFLTLDHQEPDRVPIDFWASPGAWVLIKEAVGMDKGAFLDANDVDFRYIDGPEYTGSPLSTSTDFWGVKRREVEIPTPYGKETYKEVYGFPLEEMTSADEIEGYPWPNPDDFDYSVVKAQAQAVKDAGRVVIFMGDRLNRIAQLKPAMYLRGVDKIFLDLALEPGIAHAIFDKLCSFYVTYLERIFEAAGGLIDIVLTGDDFGQQEGTLISPEMWEDFLAAGFKRYMDVIHTCGVRSMHHTCGDVRLLAGRMHELGLDILQSLQPEAMGDYFSEMKAKYGGSMSFQGGISIQRTMPKGSPDDIAAEVKERVEVLAPGGGYIFCTAHNLQADCSMENITALLDAYHTFGRYSTGG